MATVSNKCFRCGKPSVIYYDCLAVEKFQQSKQSGKWTTTATTERLAGFVRMTLCSECLQKHLIHHIAANTKKNGAPMLLKGKEVAFSQELLSRIQQGIYEKSDVMERLFILGLSDLYNYHSMADTTDWPIRVEQSSLNAAGITIDRQIESEYVLLNFSQISGAIPKPFTAPLAKMIDSSGFWLYFASRMDALENGLLLPELSQKIPKLKTLYHSSLEAI